MQKNLLDTGQEITGRRDKSPVYISALLGKVLKRKSTLHQAALECAIQIHKGERLKFVIGPYYTHVVDVSRRMNAIEDRIVALLHDAVESEYARRVKFNAELKLKFPDAQPLFHNEEQGIQQVLRDLRIYFERRGHGDAIGRAKFHKHGFELSGLLADIDVLTKRSSDKNNYEGYIQRIIDHARATGSDRAVRVKMADLLDNLDPARNPVFNNQTQKDKDRLARYRMAYAMLTEAFPNIILQDRPMDRATRVAIEERHGGHARKKRKPNSFERRYGDRSWRADIPDERQHHRPFRQQLLLG